TDLARSSYGVEAPHFVTVFGVQRGDSAANAVFGAGDAHIDQAVIETVGAGQAVAVFVVFELGAPQQLARLLVEGDEAAVEQARIDPAVADGDTAVVPTAADQVIDLGDIRIPFPDLATRLGIEGENVVVA